MGGIPPDSGEAGRSPQIVPPDFRSGAGGGAIWGEYLGIPHQIPDRPPRFFRENKHCPRVGCSASAIRPPHNSGNRITGRVWGVLGTVRDVCGPGDTTDHSRTCPWGVGHPNALLAGMGQILSEM